MSIARKDIRPTVQAALQAHSVFQSRTIIAVLDDGSEAKTDEMKAQLRDRGVVIAIPPLLGSVDQDETGDRVNELVVVRVDLRINPNVNLMSGKAQLVQEVGEDAIIGTLLRLRGVGQPLEGMRFDHEVFTNRIEDPGLETKAIYCRVPVDTEPSV